MIPQPKSSWVTRYRLTNWDDWRKRVLETINKEVLENFPRAYFYTIERPWR
jgi:hypothetical protein